MRHLSNNCQNLTCYFNKYLRIYVYHVYLRVHEEYAV